MNAIYEKLELGFLIVLSLFAKWLLSEEPIPEDEDDYNRRIRKRRIYGGLLSGFICAYFGHAPLQNKFEVLSDEDFTIPLVILLALTGEHIFRALITKVPEWINMFVEAWIRSRSNQ